jgi:hypothetical protein
MDDRKTCAEVGKRYGAEEGSYALKWEAIDSQTPSSSCLKRTPGAEASLYVPGSTKPRRMLRIQKQIRAPGAC